MKFIKKFLTCLLIAVFFILLGATIIFGGLFFYKNNEAATLSSDKSNLQTQLKSAQDQLDQFNNSKNTFTDKGLGLTLQYPITWQSSLATNISKDYVYTPVNGKVITKYDVDFTKSTSDLKFTQVLTAIDNFPQGLKKGDYDVQVLTNKIIRFEKKGTGSWSYGENLNCKDLKNDLFDLTGYDYCASSFFPGLTKDGFWFVTLTSSDANLIKEADGIVLSGVK